MDWTEGMTTKKNSGGGKMIEFRSFAKPHRGRRKESLAGGGVEKGKENGGLNCCTDGCCKCGAKKGEDDWEKKRGGG